MNSFVLSPGQTRGVIELSLVVAAVISCQTIESTVFSLEAQAQRPVAKTTSQSEVQEETALRSAGGAKTNGSSVISKSQDWRTKAIPAGPPAATTAHYHRFAVNTGNALFGEPLVNLQSYNIAAESFYARTDGLNAPYYRSMPNASVDVWCRKSVAEKLATANKMLERYNVELFVLDGWRSIEVQTSLWKFFIDRARKKFPHAGPHQWESYAAIYCSDPRRFNLEDQSTWTVHITGGAIDVTLKRKGTGEQLYMGSIFDEASTVSQTAFFERDTGTESSFEARRNRRLLYHAMLAAGFTNYCAEWWHYDYGDQMWSMMKSRTGAKDPAIYGPTAPDDKP